MGKIELDHTGSGGGVTLSSDGTDLLLDGTAIGGGGGAALELYAESPSSPTAPTVTGGTNSVAIGSGSVSDGTNSIAIGTNADSNSGVAIGYNAQATSLYATAIGADLSGNGAIGAGFGSVALGASRAGGTDSFAAAIASNSASYGATGANSVAIGQIARAISANTVALGGTFTYASGSNSVSIGKDATTFGARCFALNGGIATSADSMAIGNHAATKTVIGHIAMSGGFRFSAGGDSQQGTFILRSDTTDATPEALTTNNSTASTTNQIILPNNSAFAFHGTIVARQQASAGTASAAWKIEGLIRREGSAGTTVLVNSATTVLDNTPGWGMALSADTTNGGLKVEATGAASTNIRWVATIHTSEVTYA